jgi:DNA-binding LacI/PurR family transcriptional regulator
VGKGERLGPIWQEIHDSFLTRIREGNLKPDTVLPPEQQIAAEWGVSRLTAHRALYELQRNGHVQRKRKVGTVVLPPRSAETLTVSAAFFQVTEFYQASLLSSIRQSLEDDVRLSYVDTGHDPAREAAVLRRAAKESDGIVIFPTCHPSNTPVINKLAQSGKFIVCVDRVPEGAAVDAVVTDNYGATRQVLAQLAERGHRRIAHFTDMEPDVSSTHERLQAYLDQMEAIGLPAGPLIRTFPYIAPDTHREYLQMIQLVSDALTVLLSRPDPPTALFCLRDHYAAAAVEACRSLGVTLPDDLEIVAFIDRPASALPIPDYVHRIEQDVESIGRIATERLLARREGRPMEPETIRVPARTPVIR